MKTETEIVSKYHNDYSQLMESEAVAINGDPLHKLNKTLTDFEKEVMRLKMRMKDETASKRHKKLIKPMLKKIKKKLESEKMVTTEYLFDNPTKDMKKLTAQYERDMKKVPAIKARLDGISSFYERINSERSKNGWYLIEPFEFYDIFGNYNHEGVDEERMKLMLMAASVRQNHREAYSEISKRINKQIGYIFSITFVNGTIDKNGIYRRSGWRFLTDDNASKKYEAFLEMDEDEQLNYRLDAIKTHQ